MYRNQKENHKLVLKTRGMAANLNLLWRVVAKYTADSRSDAPVVTEHAGGTQMNTISVKDIRRRIFEATARAA